MPTTDSSLRDKFLAAFSGEIRNNILTFANALWEHDSRYFIFMARKAACFFDCMRELGIANVRGTALSDRVLDMDLGFLEGQSVTLVDDCIFTGTSLYRARQTILEAGAASVHTLTLAVNDDSIRKELLPGGAEADDLQILEPYFLLNNSDCVRQCCDIVRATSILPRPYDVDFPHATSEKLTSKGFASLLRTPGWAAHEGTSEFQKANDVRVFTLLPTQNSQREFLYRHGVEDAFAVSQEKLRHPIMKVRVYARRLDPGSWRVHLVPIVMFAAASHDDVTAALTLPETSKVTFVSETGLATAKSRYRMLHFLIAHSLLDFLAESAKQHDKLSIPTSLKGDQFEYAFHGISEQTYATFWPDRWAVRCPPVSNLDAGFEELVTPIRPSTPTSPLELLSSVISPFVQLYREREIETREFVKKNGLKKALDVDFTHSSRLVEGYSPYRLMNSIRYPGVHLSDYISLLLDRLIDFGVAVPTIAERTETCSRELRHGEDAIFGPGQERILLESLKAYLQERGAEAAWGLELQKFIVLFVQIGIRNNILEPLGLDSRIDSQLRIVSIKGHLHGPVPTFTQPVDPSGNLDPPYIDGNSTHPRWVVDQLLKENRFVLDEHGKGKHYFIGVMPAEEIGTKQTAEARQIGRCLGASVRSGLINTDNDFVLLSTCADPEQQLRALIGEVAIIRERWLAVRNSMLARVRSHEFGQAHAALRRDHDVFTAINSGGRKYRWFVGGAFHERIYRTYSSLQCAPT